jgi:hypothetical protein
MSMSGDGFACHGAWRSWKRWRGTSGDLRRELGGLAVIFFC